MKNQMPEKPKTTKGQVDALWDICSNHILGRLRWQDVKLNFILGFMGLVMVVLGVLASLIILG